MENETIKDAPQSIVCSGGIKLNLGQVFERLAKEQDNGE